MNKFLILLTLAFTTAAHAETLPAISAKKYTAIKENSTAVAKTGRVSFTGIAAVYNNGKAVLEWKVQENEAGNHFELQSSADGVVFRTQAMLFFSEATGQDVYRFKCNNTKQTYRIKIVNKDGSESYSQAFTIQQ